MLALDGTGYLYMEAGIAGNYPLTILEFSGIGTGVTSTFVDVWHGNTANTASVALEHASFGDNLTGRDRSEGATRTIVKALTAGFNAVRLKAVIFTTSQTRAAYYGSDVEATETFGTARANHFPGHDKVVIGGSWNGTAYVPSFKGSLGEIHFIAGTISDADYNDIVSGTKKPEEIAGWIDGWSLKDFAPGGTYTSLGGMRTLTAVGGVSASAQPHPVTRTTTTFSVTGAGAIASGVAFGTASLSFDGPFMVTGAGGIASGVAFGTAVATFSIGGTLNFQAAGMEFGSRSGLGVGTFGLENGKSYRYTVHANGTTLGNPLLTSSAITLDSAGKLPNLTSSSLTPGTTYRVCAIRQSDGEACIFRMVAA